MNTTLPKIGNTISGSVARIATAGRMNRPYVLLDIDNFKYAASLPYEEAEGLDIGDQLDVRLLGIDEDEGLALVSRHQLLQDEAWEQIEKDVADHSLLSFKPQTVTRGGIIGRLGDYLEGFLPASKTNVSRFHDLSKLIGREEIEVVALEAERERGNVLVSMNAALDQKREQVLSQYRVGESYELEVVGSADFGLFLDLDGEQTVTGLLHASELSYKAGKQDPAKHASVGDRITVKLMKIGKGKNGLKVAFSKKKLFDPWLEAAGEMKAGQEVEGKVINVRDDLGSFISLGKYPRVVGLLRDYKLEKGQSVKVKLESFDAKKQKARLSLV